MGAKNNSWVQFQNPAVGEVFKRKKRTFSNLPRVPPRIQESWKILILEQNSLGGDIEMSVSWGTPYARQLRSYS